MTDITQITLSDIQTLSRSLSLTHTHENKSIYILKLIKES